MVPSAKGSEHQRNQHSGCAAEGAEGGGSCAHSPLVEVGGAAAEVRRDTKASRIGAVGLPRVFLLPIQRVDLVGLLQVLVGPHVACEGGGEGVVGDPLGPVDS